MNILKYDFHVHAGNEARGRKPGEFLSALEARGVVFAGLCDHAEFYFERQSQWHVDYRAAAAARGETLYPPSLDGLKAWCADLKAARRKAAMPFVVGLELCRYAETPDSFLEVPEFLSMCFSIRDDPTREDFGAVAAERIRQFAAKIKPAGKPGIVNHPFRDRYGAYRDMVAAGQTPPPVEKFISRDDVARIAGAAGENGLFVEVNIGALSYYSKFETVVDLCVRAEGLLAESGVGLSVGSDCHQPPAALAPEMVKVVQQAGLTAKRFEPVARKLRALLKRGKPRRRSAKTR